MTASIAIVYCILYKSHCLFTAFVLYEPIPEATVAEDEECEGTEEMFEAGRPGQASIGMDSTPHNTYRVCVFG